MSTTDTFDVIIDLSTKAVINIRILSLFFIVPENRCHPFKWFSLKLFSEIFIFCLNFDSIQILMDTIYQLFHKLMSIFLLPVNEKHTYFSWISQLIHTDFFKGSVDISTKSLFWTTSMNKFLYIYTTSLFFPLLYL